MFLLLWTLPLVVKAGHGPAHDHDEPNPAFKWSREANQPAPEEDPIDYEDLEEIIAHADPHVHGGHGHAHDHGGHGHAHGGHGHAHDHGGHGHAHRGGGHALPRCPGAVQGQRQG